MTELVNYSEQEGIILYDYCKYSESMVCGGDGMYPITVDHLEYHPQVVENGDDLIARIVILKHKNEIA